MMYTYIKAMLAEAGSNIYQGFEPFIGLMMLHGLAPSTRMSYKFCDQEANPVNGNDLVKESFGKNIKKICRMWNCFLGFKTPEKTQENTSKLEG